MPTRPFRFALPAAALALLVACEERPTVLEPLLGPVAAAASPGLPAPSGTTATATAPDQVDVAWQDNSPNENGFEVHRSTGGGTFALLAIVASNNKTHRDQGLTAGTAYCYKVRAFRSAGTIKYSAFTSTACATTPVPPPPPPPPPPTPPVAPTNIRTTPLADRMEVGWSHNAQQTDGYRVESSIDGGVSWLDRGDFFGGWAYVDAVPDLMACYRVFAFNAGGDSPPSASSCGAPPLAPTNLNVSVVDAQTIDITWSDNSAIEDGYKVWVTNCPGICNADFTVYYEVIAELPANATSYRTTNDYSGLYVLVEARKGFGWSYPSSPVLVPWP